MTTVIVWVWAWTVTYPNPACGTETPLVSKWWLGEKKGKEVYIVPKVVGDHVEYSIGHDSERASMKQNDETIDRNGTRYLACEVYTGFDYFRSESRNGRMGTELTMIATEGRGSRTYSRPDRAHTAMALCAVPSNVPMGELPEAALGFRVQIYSILKHSDLFSSRQLTVLTTFLDLVDEVRERILQDALAGRMSGEEYLEAGGISAAAYADVVAMYLGIAVDRTSAVNYSLARWDAASSKESMTDVSSWQALPMVRDHAEKNPLRWGPINLDRSTEWVLGTLSRLPTHNNVKVFQADAASHDYRDAVVSTDPLYYDNIGYPDPSDLFYVWLRRSLKGVRPPLFFTMLTPKAEELIANPYRRGSEDGTRGFLEDGFCTVFTNTRRSANLNYPMTVYCTFKQVRTSTEGRIFTD